MAFSMHSHSGQFCPGHAQDQLEDIIQHAISIGYKTIGLTEHMPRLAIEDLYPEELEPSPEETLAILPSRHEAYIDEAHRLQQKYAPQIHIIIGFEGEWYGLDRAPVYAAQIRELANSDPRIDFFIGSLHHVNTVPIDYSPELYRKAVQATEGTEEALYAAYYDSQYDMLTSLKPRVVGHFDLVRLMSEDPGRDVERAWPHVWARIRRNLDFVVGYGGWLECNSSGLRKGLAEPYPGRRIAEEYLGMGGRFTVSDDSHGIAQVATHYGGAVEYLESLGVEVVWTLERSPPTHPGGQQGRAMLKEKPVALEEFKKITL